MSELASQAPESSPQGAVPLVRLRHVGKTFSNGTIALAGLDLSVETGEFLTLLGSSGCGKSTVLRLIAGLTEPTSGDLIWRREGADAARPEIGFVFQDSTLMPWSSVFDNVWLPLRLQGLSRRLAGERIEEALNLVGLAGFARSRPRELSGGMKMRVSIARALVMRPSILLMDEPFAALDEITRFKLNDDLLRLKSDLGATVVFVTHSVYESVYLSTRIAVFGARPGRIVEIVMVDEPLPRDDEFRVSSLYAERCRTASRALQNAMGPEDQL
jgi:NitT/TauT family transport system ATP-binding protein